MTQSGGFVPVVTTNIADTKALAPKDADELRAKVKRAALAAGAPRPGQPAYVIVVEDGDDQKRVHLGEADLNDAHRDLIDFVGSVTGHEEKIGPLGG